MQNSPTGTVTFLFTDIEGSTRLWEQHGDAMKQAHRRQEAILLDAIQSNGGYPYKMIGDAFQAAFYTASQALQAALDAQCALHSEQWGDVGDLRVRMALHTGVADERQGDYTGPVLYRAFRLMSTGHGGQILLSQATEELVRDHLPAGVTLRDMGEHRLRDLIRPERISQLVAESLPSEFPPLKTLDNRPNNLPLQSTPLIGREKEVEAVRSRLLSDDTHGQGQGHSHVRLLTLTGPGGIGKTRLALQAAAEMLDDFPNGVFFINLAPLVDPGLVVPTIAYTLGLREAGGQPIGDTLKEYLKDKRLVLVLDNFEQVLEAASQISDLLKAAAHLKMLVTSRAPLNLSMEHQYAVPPLAVPDPRQQHGPEALSQYGAVTLFIQRAQAVKPNFQMNNANAPAVAEVCYRLEGIPLAIELAAARVKVLSPQALLDRLGNRLKLLTGGATDLPSRQQTLRNTIDWSYDLLTEGEKQLFRRASVFRGGRTLEAVEEVCNGGGDLEVDVLEGITSLVDKSLMYTVEGTGGEARYWMLETIYEHATEKLDESGEGEEIRRQHALYFMKLGEQAEPELMGAQQAEWLGRLEEEHDNLRAVLRRGMESGGAGGSGNNAEAAQAVEAGLRLAGAIWRFWWVRGYFSEGREWLTGLLGLSGLRALGALPEVPGVRDEGTAEAQPTLGTYRARALNAAGVLAQYQGNNATARSLYEESLALKRELGDKSGIALSLNNLGNLAAEQGDYATARSLYEESLALKRELGYKRGIALSLNNLGNLAHEQGDYATARSLHEESLALARELGNKSGIARSLSNLGNVVYAQGDYATARSLYEESLALMRELGDKRGTALSLGNLGSVAHEQGDYATARSLYEESLALMRELGDKRGIAYELNNLGNVAHEQGDYATARSLYEESLALRREIGDKKGTAGSLAGLGAVEVGTGGVEWVERGARLLAAVQALLEETGAVFDRVDRIPYEQAVASARAQLDEEAFNKAWEEGRTMSMEEAIKYALEGTNTLAANPDWDYQHSDRQASRSLW